METLLLENYTVSLIVTTSLADKDRIIIDLNKLHHWAKKRLGNFEMIVVSDNSLDISNGEKSLFVSDSEGVIWINLGAVSNREVQTTAGLDTAIGDLTLEFRAAVDSISDLESLYKRWNQFKHDEVIVFCPKKENLLNWTLSKLVGYRVLSSDLGLRLMSRESLQPWFVRQDRHKSVRLAHHHSDRVVAYVLYDSKPKFKNPRVVRESIRSAIQVTPSPLRWAAMLGILGSLLSLGWAITILLIGIRNDVVEGWTTTNLQISTLFFFTSLVLSILAEYVYQISVMSSRILPYRIRDEFTSSAFPLREAANVEIIKYSDGGNG